MEVYFTMSSIQSNDKREKTKDRVRFDYEKRKKILEKTRCRCGRCGKDLDTTTMTVDHVIPLSKGGTNETSNLVALCDKCNQAKSNYVLNPIEYFRYLDNVYLEKLKRTHGEYLEKVNWFSKRNMFSEDMYEYNEAGKIVKYTYTKEDRKAIKSGDGKVFRDKVNSRMEKKGLFTTSSKKLFYVKAKYNDLDDIYNAYKKQLRTMGMWNDGKKELLKNFISDFYLNGTIYIVRNISGDICVVIPMWYIDSTLGESYESIKDSSPLFPTVMCNYDLEGTNIYFNYENPSGENRPMFAVCNMLVTYAKVMYLDGLLKFLYKLLDEDNCGLNNLIKNSESHLENGETYAIGVSFNFIKNKAGLTLLSYLETPNMDELGNYSLGSGYFGTTVTVIVRNGDIKLFSKDSDDWDTYDEIRAFRNTSRLLEEYDVKRLVAVSDLWAELM